MTSTDGGPQVGGHRCEVDFQKLGPALLIASSLVLAIRTARWSPTTSDGLAHVEWEKEVEHSVRIAKIVLSPLISPSPELFETKEVPWYVATDQEVPKKGGGLSTKVHLLANGLLQPDSGVFHGTTRELTHTEDPWLKEYLA